MFRNIYLNFQRIKRISGEWLNNYRKSRSFRPLFHPELRQYEPFDYQLRGLKFHCSLREHTVLDSVLDRDLNAD